MSSNDAIPSTSYERNGNDVVMTSQDEGDVEVLSNPASTDSSSIHEKTMDEFAADNSSGKKRCCEWFYFNDVDEAKGYCRLGMARGPLVMSNIFLSTSLIYLASGQADCLVMPENGAVDAEGQYDYAVETECTATVYGFRPSSLITNIAVISGLMSAFFMPFIGALIDYTNYRRQIGIASAILMTLIQAVQIGTLSATWYPMAILQAIAGWLYQVQVLATYAYLPDIARKVGEQIMTGYTATFVSVQFISQATFLVAIVAISMGLGLNDVRTGQLSQGVNVATSVTFFVLGWKLMPNVAAKHELQPGQHLMTQGFIEIFRTAKHINRHYGKSLRWYLLATVFAEAGANAFTVVSVVYLDETLHMSGSQIGIIFLITLISTVPGSKIASFVTSKTNPNTSWKLAMATFIVATIIGALILSGPERQNLAYMMGAVWGICLGWFYPTENLMFSLALPKGQEAAVTGFFVYCTQILVWLPPLVFTALNEAGVHQSYGVMSMSIYFSIAIIILCFIPNNWDLFIQEVNHMNSSRRELQNNENNNGNNDEEKRREDSTEKLELQM